MSVVTINANAGKLLKYVEKSIIVINKNIIKPAALKKVRNLFRDTSREIFSNLAFFNNYDFTQIKSQKINSPSIKQILNKELNTKYSEQIVNENNKLNIKDKKKLMQNIELVIHKIKEMKKYSQKTDKELNRYKKFRPLSRLKHIKKIYIEIRNIIK